MSQARATNGQIGRSEAQGGPRGDEQELFEQYADHLQRVVASATRASRETVEDACSFAWAQLLRNQPERENVVGWLRVVAIHEVYRLWHKTRGELPIDAPLPGSQSAPGGTFERTQRGSDDVPQRAELDSVLAEIAELPERRRRIFELHLSGLSYREIGALTGEGQRAIDRQIQMARRRLRSDFSDPGPV